MEEADRDLRGIRRTYASSGCDWRNLLTSCADHRSASYYYVCCAADRRKTTVSEYAERKVKDRWGSHRSFEGSINN